MSCEIYAFGSATRGEVSRTSDIDILAISFTDDRSRFPAEWSIYAPRLVEEYFRRGRLFAWHLHTEARCIYSPNVVPFLESLGQPAAYSTMARDIDDLEELLMEAIAEIRARSSSLVYELGIVYTAMRDIAMSASWALLSRPCFSRNAPYRLPIPCPVPATAYDEAMLARHSSTRGIDIEFDMDETARKLTQAPIAYWIQELRNAT